MSLELAQERINTLDIKKLDNGLYGVLYEFQYTNKDGSKVWQKELALCTLDNLTHGELSEIILRDVVEMRAELER